MKHICLNIHNKTITTKYLNASFINYLLSSVLVMWMNWGVTQHCTILMTVLKTQMPPLKASMGNVLSFGSKMVDMHGAAR